MDRITRSKHGATISVFAAAAVVLMAVGWSEAPKSARPLAANRSLTPVNVVMGYEPNVQFAPFYAAIKLGYYRTAGLKVSFNYTTEPNALQLLSEGHTDFVDSGGDEVLTAGAAGLHVKYVMTQYSRFPSALFFLKHHGIARVADLRGKTIGVPFEFGASYYGLLALLADNGLPAKSVHIESINYNQVAAVGSGKVNAAMGYAPNEPVELRSEGRSVGEFDVYHWANIAGAGLATSDSLIASHPSLVRAFVHATLKGLRFTLAHPNDAFHMSRTSIPDITNLRLQRRILLRALAFWKPARVRLGHMDPHVWKLTARVLRQFKVIAKPVQARGYYTNRFVS